MKLAWLVEEFVFSSESAADQYILDYEKVHGILLAWTLLTLDPVDSVEYVGEGYVESGVLKMFTPRWAFKSTIAGCKRVSERCVLMGSPNRALFIKEFALCLE